MGDDGAHRKMQQIGPIPPLEQATIQRAQVTVASIALKVSESPGEARLDAHEVLCALGIRARVN